MFASLVLLMAAANKKEKKANALKDVALVAGTQQNLSNLYSLDICGYYNQLKINSLLDVYGCPPIDIYGCPPIDICDSHRCSVFFFKNCAKI